MKDKSTLVPVVLAGIAAGALVGLMVVATNEKNGAKREKLNSLISDPLYKKYADMLRRLNAKLDNIKEVTADLV